MTSGAVMSYLSVILVASIADNLDEASLPSSLGRDG